MVPENRTIADGVDLLILPDDRFKTMQLTVALLLPFQENTASANALVAYLLRRGCAAYPDYAALQQRLDRLYGAGVSASVIRLGDRQMLTLNAVSLRDELALSGESVVAASADLLCQMLFDPVLEDGVFRREDVEQEKRCLIELIESEINEKRLYARHRCEELLCPGEGYALPRWGRVEQVAALTPAELTAAWKRILKEARIQIILQGGDGEAVAGAFRSGLTMVDRRPLPAIPTQVQPAKPAVTEGQETMSINQSKLVMGFRSTDTMTQGDVAAARVMSALFGGTAHSLLFRHVRERLSLCYYCVSGYDACKGIMLVDAGVALDKVSDAREEILRQLEDVRQGRFDDEDLAAAIRSLVSAIQTVEDAQDSSRSFYLGQVGLDHVETPAMRAAEIEQVTRERVMAAAERAVLDSVFLLAQPGGAG